LIDNGENINSLSSSLSFNCDVSLSLASEGGASGGGASGGGPIEGGAHHTSTAGDITWQSTIAGGVTQLSRADRQSTRDTNWAQQQCRADSQSVTDTNCWALQQCRADSQSVTDTNCWALQHCRADECRAQQQLTGHACEAQQLMVCVGELRWGAATAGDHDDESTWLVVCRREEAEMKLSGREAGTFLIRPSSEPKSFALSIV